MNFFEQELRKIVGSNIRMPPLWAGLAMCASMK